MRKQQNVFFVILIMVIFLFGCSGSDDSVAKIPSSSDEYAGKNYNDVITEIKNAGFSNVQSEADEDLITGWLHEDGEVESVSVNGDPEYSDSKRYSKDVLIIVKYHAFPAETDENNLDDNLSSEIINTIDNNPDLANILSIEAESCVEYSDFADKYKGQIIQFDGHIDYLVNHGDYTTRYDLLLSSSDWIDEDSVTPGPIFKLKDVNMLDLGIKELYLPDYIAIGSNVVITAKVVDFNAETCLFQLDPVLVEKR